jgi:hypothetical protein
MGPIVIFLFWEIWYLKGDPLWVLVFSNFSENFLFFKKVEYGTQTKIAGIGYFGASEGLQCDIFTTGEGQGVA